jgi:hypothetical protein
VHFVNLFALSDFNLDFAIPSAARNLLVCCAIAHAQAAGRSSSHRSWSISHPHGSRTSREILKAPRAMTDDCFLTKCVFHESSIAPAFMNHDALPAFNLDFAIPRAARNLLVCCANAHAQAAGRSSSHRIWSISHPHGSRTSREILKAPHVMTENLLSNSIRIS